MSIQFACPHCNAETHVDARFAGQTGPCRNCGQTITIPGVSVAGAMGQGTPAKKSMGAGAIIAVLLGIGFVGLFVIGLLVALLLPAVSTARFAAQRANSMNNQKQILLALLNYESAYGSFPPQFTVDENGRPMHSWRVLVLPFTEELGIFQQYDFSQPWDSPGNLALTSSNCPPVYQSPLDASRPGGYTTYVGMSGPGAIFDGEKAHVIGDVEDGTSKTIAIVEIKDSTIHWAEPRDLDATTASFDPSTATTNDFGTSRPGQPTLVGYIDGHVEASTDSPQMLRAKSTISGQEMVP